MNIFKWALVAVLILWMAGSAFSAWQLVQAYRAIDDWQAEAERLEAQAEQDYYRGIFDTWQWLAVVSGKHVDSLNLVRKAHEANWYGQASAGWYWPPEGDQQPKSSGR